jgi:hypothetical protein
VGSSVYDLAYCLCFDASKVVFDQISANLQFSDAEKLFPFGALVQHWKSCAKFGMFSIFLILTIKVTVTRRIL